jgi:hypothetical protein
LDFRGVSVKLSAIEQVFGKKGRRRYRHFLGHEDKGRLIYYEEICCVLGYVFEDEGRAEE